MFTKNNAVGSIPIGTKQEQNLKVGRQLPKSLSSAVEPQVEIKPAPIATETNEISSQFEELYKLTADVEKRGIMLKMRERALNENIQNLNSRVRRIQIPEQFNELADKYQNLLERAKILYENKELIAPINDDGNREIAKIEAKIQEFQAKINTTPHN